MKPFARLFIATILALLPVLAAAEDQTRVEPSSTEQIDKHDVCRVVTNNTGAPIMIPHLTPTEWAVGSSAFLSNPYPNVVVSACPSGLWYWELQDTIVRRCQGSLGSGTCTDYFNVAGMPITTRFSQYNSPTTYGEPGTMPVCDADRAGERGISQQVTGTTSQTLFRRTFVCNRAVEISPLAFSDIRLAPGATATVGQMTVSGLPHTGTEAFITGLTYSAPTADTRVTPRLYLNGTAGSVYHTEIPVGHITADSPYLNAFNTAYGTTRWAGMGVPVRNTNTVRIDVTAPPQEGTYRLFAKLGDRITYFNVEVAAPPVQPLTSGGSISASSSYHPVFSLFQNCFKIGPGAHINFPGACTMDAAFWDEFRSRACQANPYSLSIAMGQFVLSSSGSACSTVGFEDFHKSARVSTCRPTTCAISDSGGPASCNFSCD